MKVERYQAYKDSGIEWLSEMPEHWGEKRIKDLSFLQSGINITSAQIEEVDKYPVYGGNGLRGYFAKYTNEGDYILIGRQGALCGNINYASGKFWATEHAVVVYLKRSVATKWYGETLRVMNLNQYSLSAAQPGLAVDRIKRLLLPVPPFSEQKAIAHYLDTKTAQIDRKIDLLAQKAQLYSNLKQSLINETVTRGLEKTVPMKDSGIEWIGEVPEHWEEKRIKDLSFLQSGINITSDQIEEIEQYPVYGGNGLRGYFSKYTNEGDYILIGRQGALCGNINYASGKFWATEHAVVVYLKRSFDMKWYGEMLRVMNLNQYSLSAAQPGLAVDRIKRLLIPVPPLPEQKAIADYLDTKTAQIDQIIQTINTQIEKLKELRKTLINDVVTGKIKVTE